MKYVPIAVAVLGGGIKSVLKEVGRVLSELPKIEPTILRTALIGSDTVIRKFSQD